MRNTGTISRPQPVTAHGRTIGCRGDKHAAPYAGSDPHDAQMKENSQLKLARRNGVDGETLDQMREMRTNLVRSIEYKAAGNWLKARSGRR